MKMLVAQYFWKDSPNVKNPGEEEREKEGHRLCAHIREQEGGLQMNKCKR